MIGAGGLQLRLVSQMAGIPMPTDLRESASRVHSGLGPDVYRGQSERQVMARTSYSRPCPSYGRLPRFSALGIGLRYGVNWPMPVVRIASLSVQRRCS